MLIWILFFLQSTLWCIEMPLTLQQCYSKGRQFEQPPTNFFSLTLIFFSLFFQWHYWSLFYNITPNPSSVAHLFLMPLFHYFDSNLFFLCLPISLSQSPFFYSYFTLSPSIPSTLSFSLFSYPYFSLSPSLSFLIFSLSLGHTYKHKHILSFCQMGKVVRNFFSIFPFRYLVKIELSKNNYQKITINSWIIS